jgi:hypothetical protein
MRDVYVRVARARIELTERYEVGSAFGRYRTYTIFLVPSREACV